MPSTYSPNLRLTLPATNDLSGTWGSVVNAGVTTMVEEAITGFLSIAMTTADYTLSTGNGVTDEARQATLKFTGVIGAARNVIVPSVPKQYTIVNSTTGGFAITVKTAAGSGIAVPAGTTSVVRCDGTNVVVLFSYLSSVSIGALTTTGAAVIGSGVTISGGMTVSGMATISGGMTVSGVVTLESGFTISGGYPAIFSGIVYALDIITVIGASSKIGYGVGSGGAVTQGTSRTTGVTINKGSGAITMFSAAGSAVYASFVVTNSTIAATDTVVLTYKSGATNVYHFLPVSIQAGSFAILFATLNGGTATDAPVINFTIFGGAAS